jgi:MFS transporter, DHA3 family, macrolide efflux protein
MRNFLLLWFGQLTSLLGSNITAFAMTIWAWQETGQATALAAVGFFAFLPIVIVSPFAVVVVDRWSRKAVLIWSDAASAMFTLILLILYASGNLVIWHVFILVFLSGIVSSFQTPALLASIAPLVPEHYRTRANGLRTFAGYGTQIAAPFLAGILMVRTGLEVIFLIDLVTFLVAVSTLALITIPRPGQMPSSPTGTLPMWREIGYGLEYIYTRPSLFGITVVSTCLNLLGMIGLVVLTPMILARTGGSETIVGSVHSFLGIGGLIGGLVLSIWAGPKQKIHGVILGIVGGSLSMGMLGLGQGIVVWFAASFLLTFFMPMIDTYAYTIYQNKIPSAVQGRVFATLRAVSQIGTTIAFLMSGVLADRVFEPLLMSGGDLASSLRWLVGSGPGAGMGLMIVVSSVLTLLVGVGAMLYQPVREIEELLPNASPVTSLADSPEIPVASEGT